MATSVEELEPVNVLRPSDGGAATIRVFRLHLNGVTVELTSLGASITKFLVPNGDENVKDDDIVLGYPSVKEMYESDNPCYFGVVVGRVANRIAKGQLQMPLLDNDQQKKHGSSNVEHPNVIQLDVNNGPNHLHGGLQGFSRKIWDAKVLPPDDDNKNQNKNRGDSSAAVEFSLISPHGDQGYPGSVRVTATYRLELLPGSSFVGDDNTTSSGRTTRRVALSLSMHAQLEQEGSVVAATPINLAQHSYFNLNRHNAPEGILHHSLHLDGGCHAYTPVDRDSIPTRQVVPLTHDDTMKHLVVVRERNELSSLQDILIECGVNQACLTREHAQRAVTTRNLTIIGGDSSTTEDGAEAKSVVLSPFGLDHNFVVIDDDDDDDVVGGGKEQEALLPPLRHVARVDCGGRSLVVRSTAPGVQVYTANYLDTAASDCYKDGARYKPWQGLCLETQHFPDSINVFTNSDDSDFAKGKCVILTPQQDTYTHTVVYEVCFPAKRSATNNAAATDGDAVDSDDIATWVGRDSYNNRIASVQAMWESQRVTTLSSSSSSSWYRRAAEHYEESCDATLSGVLGGFAPLSELDLQGSLQFVQERLQQSELQLLTGKMDDAVACECGAGIGRVSKGLLLPLGFGRVDLVESSTHLLEAAPEFIGDEHAHKCRFYCTGLQDWTPVEGRYTLIWIQWVFCYLTDDDAIAFLQRCAKGLVVGGGVIVLKENTVMPHEEDQEDAWPADFVLDPDDASVTRSLRYLLHLIRQVGNLKVVALQEAQPDLPKDNFPVATLALSVGAM